MEDDSYIYDKEFKEFRNNKIDAINKCEYEMAAFWRDKEATFVLEKYGINIRTNFSKQ